MGKCMAITLWQPWASLIATGAKTFETRSWSTRYRGWLMIHSSKRYTKAEKQYTDHFIQTYKSAENLINGLPLGCMLCVVKLVDVHRVEDVRDRLPADELAYGNYADGRYAWELKFEHSIIPVPVKGEQGLWTWEYE